MRQLRPFFPRFVFSDPAPTREGRMPHVTLGPTPDSIPHSSKIGKKASSLAWRLDGSLNSKVCHLLSLPSALIPEVSRSYQDSSSPENLK